MKPDLRTKVLRVLALAFVISLSVFLYFMRDQLAQFQGFGYPGIFLIQLLSSATVILPVPGLLITTAMGAVFNPFWVAVASGS